MTESLQSNMDLKGKSSHLNELSIGKTCENIPVTRKKDLNEGNTNLVASETTDLSSNNEDIENSPIKKQKGTVPFFCTVCHFSSSPECVLRNIHVANKKVSCK